MTGEEGHLIVADAFGHNAPSPTLRGVHLGPRLHHDAHIFMAENVAAFHWADRHRDAGPSRKACSGDLDDRVVWMLELRSGDSVDAHVTLACRTALSCGVPYFGGPCLLN